MKKLFTSIFILCFLEQVLIAQNVTIPDANFKVALINGGIDKNNDGEIQIRETELVKK